MDSLPELPVSATSLIRKRSKTEGSNTETAATADGRCCRLCNSKDSSPDPVFPHQNRCWNYQPIHGRTSGYYCWYCGRLFQARFKHLHKNIGALATECGKNGDLMADFSRLLSDLISRCVANKSRDLRIVAGELQQQQSSVSERNILEAGLEESDDFVQLDHYIHRYRGGMGDPRSNGLGHVIQVIGGEAGVVVPSEPVKKLRRSRKVQVVQENIVDDGSCNVMDNQQSVIMEEMYKNICLPPAVGAILYDDSVGAKAGDQVDAAGTGKAVGAPAASLPSSSTSTSGSLPLFGCGANFFNIGAPSAEPPTKRVETASKTQKPKAGVRVVAFLGRLGKTTSKLALLLACRFSPIRWRQVWTLNSGILKGDSVGFL